MADPIRVAELSVPYFANAGVPMAPDGRGLEFLASATAIATGSVDRLDQVPARLAFLFDYAPARTLEDPRVREEMSADGPRAVVRALAEVLAAAPRLDRERFRAAANEVKARTGHKAKALFHPIRVARQDARKAGARSAIPAIDGGADLPPEAGIPPIAGCRARGAPCRGKLA
jgi:hypothetical protein